MKLSTIPTRLADPVAALALLAILNETAGLLRGPDDQLTCMTPGGGAPRSSFVTG